jgi:hypothetical protein
MKCCGRFAGLPIDYQCQSPPDSFYVLLNKPPKKDPTQRAIMRECFCTSHQPTASINFKQLGVPNFGWDDGQRWYKISYEDYLVLEIMES